MHRKLPTGAALLALDHTVTHTRHGAHLDLRYSPDICLDPKAQTAPGPQADSKPHTSGKNATESRPVAGWAGLAIGSAFCFSLSSCCLCFLSHREESRRILNFGTHGNCSHQLLLPFFDLDLAIVHLRLHSHLHARGFTFSYAPGRHDSITLTRTA